MSNLGWMFVNKNSASLDFLVHLSSDVLYLGLDSHNMAVEYLVWKKKQQKKLCQLFLIHAKRSNHTEETES